VLLFEYVHSDRKKTACTAINVFDAIPLAALCLYFLFVGRNTQAFLYFTTAIGFLSLTLAFLLPESPRWLLMQGRTEEAIKSLNYIAKFNGSKNRIAPDAQFVEAQAVEVSANLSQLDHDTIFEKSAIVDALQASNLSISKVSKKN
jgi:hypothetical protein